MLRVNIIDRYCSCTEANYFSDESHQMWKLFSSQHELVSNQELKEQNNLLIVNNNNKNDKNVVLLSLLLTNFTNCAGVSIVTLNKQIPHGQQTLL